MLQTLSEGICAFQEDCIQLGIADRVMGMTYSEFGRRIRSNESDGTDHGTAAPILVFGSCVNPSIIGDNADISVQATVAEGVAMQFDFRSVYATMLMDWFGISEEQVRTVLFDDFQHLPLLTCSAVSTEDKEPALYDMSVAPNPFGAYFDLRFTGTGDTMRISLYDALGSELRIISNQKFTSDQHHIKIPTSELPGGIYFVRIAGRSQQKTLRVIKGL